MRLIQVRLSCKGRAAGLFADDFLVLECAPRDRLATAFLAVLLRVVLVRWLVSLVHMSR
jgi:hypothetical protein